MDHSERRQSPIKPSSGAAGASEAKTSWTGSAALPVDEEADPVCTFEFAFHSHALDREVRSRRQG